MKQKLIIYSLSGRGEIQKGAQVTILTNFFKTSFAAFLQWHPEAIHV